VAAHLYVDVATLKSRLGINSDRDVQVLTSAVTAASRAIDQYCGRRFWCDTTVSARQYMPLRSERGVVLTHDIATTTGVVVDFGTDGTYPTTVAATDYQLEPFGGIGPDGNPGWPYERLELLIGWFPIYSGTYPTSRWRRTVQITAQWGWLAVPDPVAEACAMMAADLFHLKDNRFGVAGVNDFGPIRVSENRVAAGLLANYRRASAFLSVA
jgi:hypothetical protein